METAAKHTPGPWNIERPAVDRIVILGADDSVVADCCDGFWNDSEQYVPAATNEPNAKLISAAPELLEVLAEICNTWGEPADKPGLELSDLIEIGRKLIAKATA